MLPAKPWLPERVLLLLLSLFFSVFIGLLLIGWVNAGEWLGAGGTKFLSVLIGAFSFHVMALILTHSMLRQHGMAWTEAFGFNSPRMARSSLLGVLVAFAVLPIVWALQQLSARIMTSAGWETAVQSQVEVLRTTDLFRTQFLIGFLAIALAPVAEEVVFRGILYPVLKQKGFPKLALLGTALLFAAFHGNMVIFLPLTFLAVVLTLLYETTGNLLAPILAHSVFNLVNFTRIMAQPSGTLIPAA
jgi:uncharacterized protein